MKKNILNNYILKCLNSLESNLNNYQKLQAPEDLHYLRVNIKKIKAIFLFAAKVYGKNFDSNKLNTVFEKAGEIRELQINLQLLNASPSFPEKYIHQLIRNETKLQQDFLKNCPEYLKQISNFRNELSLPKEFPAKKHIQRYFNKELKKASKEFKREKKKSMHCYRHKIKSLLYIHDALPKKLQECTGLKRKPFNSQQKKIGQWHDLYTALKFLSQQNFRPKTEDFVAKLKQKENKEFKLLVRK